MSPDLILYISQFCAASLLALVLEFGFHRRYEASGHTVLPATWGIAQVGLLVLARLHLVPLVGFSAQEGALQGWWITFWSFVASAIPIATWQMITHQRQIWAIFDRRQAP